MSNQTVEKIDHQRKEYRSFYYLNYTREEINARNKAVVELYKSGLFTLEDIGKKYNLTCERIRQICNYHAGLDRREVLNILQKRFLKKIEDKYVSIENYGRLLKAQEAKRLLKQERKEAGAWHWKYDRCSGCGTTTKPYHSNSRCESCATRYLYQYSEKRRALHKITCRNYRLKNLDKIKADQKEYYQKNKEHYMSPEFRERNNSRNRMRYKTDPEYRKKLNDYQSVYKERPEVKARLKEYYKRPDIIERYKPLKRAYYLKNRDRLKLYYHSKYEQQKKQINNI